MSLQFIAWLPRLSLINRQIDAQPIAHFASVQFSAPDQGMWQFEHRTEQPMAAATSLLCC
jgi:hypothetical protein